MFLKDPDAVLDYRVDWSGALGEEVGIAGSGWAVAPGGAGAIAILADGIDGASAWVRLGGGTAGHVYELSNRVTLSDASVDERSLTIRVEER